MGKSSITLTADQKRCVEAKGSLAILAGAGSGKTAVIVERIKELVVSGKADLSDIAAITFTEKAAGELVYRLTSELPAKYRANIDLATITTIDGFCSRVLREDGPLLGISPDFMLLEEHASRILTHRTISKTLKELLNSENIYAQNLIEELDFKHSVSCIEDLLEYKWHTNNLIRAFIDEITDSEASDSELPSMEEIFGKGITDREEDLAQATFECYKIVLEKLTAEKKELNVLDFQDLEILTLKLLKENSDVRKKYQLRIKHLLIDEFQDTSDLQIEIIKHIYKPKKNNLCIVGDPGQSIYRFRGANPKGIKEIQELISSNGGKTIELKTNFRSTPNVLGFINNIFKHDQEEEEEELNSFLELNAHSESADDSGAVILNFDAADAKAEERRTIEANALANYIDDEISKNKISYGDIAILFRSFTDIQIYEKAFESHKIPYYRNGGRSFLIQPEINDILLCLRCLNDPENNTLAYGLARSTIIGMSEDKAYRLTKTKESTILEALAKDHKFLSDLLADKNYLNLSELVRRIADKTSLPNVFELIRGSSQPTTNIEKLISIADDLSNNYDYNLSEFIDFIDDMKSRGLGISEPPTFGTRDNAVKLLTIHAAKGLEFKTVILADLSRSSRPHALPYIIDKGNSIGFKMLHGLNPISERRATDLFESIKIAEEAKEALERERLLYVAATRAKEKLIIPSLPEKASKGSWAKYLKSHICELQATNPTIKAPTNENRIADNISFYNKKKRSASNASIFTVSSLESFHRCPQEYKLKYILQVPAEKINPISNEMGKNTIGNIVHSAIQILAENKIDNIELLIERIAENYGFFNLAKPDKTSIKKHLETYLKSEFESSRLKKPLHETPFAIKVSSSIIKGTIDCIYEDNGGLSILDYKTDTVRTSEDVDAKVKDYSFQTMIYALAAKRSLKKEIAKTSLYFLGRDEIRTENLAKDCDKQAEKEIITIITSIENEDFSIGDQKRPCQTCPYHHNNTCWEVKL